MFQVNQAKLQSTSPLDKNISGKVFPYQKDDSDYRWVVKHIETNDSKTFLKNVQHIILAFNCDHPAILPVNGFNIEEDFQNNTFYWNLYIKMNRMNGSIKDVMREHLANNTFVQKEELVKYIHNLASGLEYLQNRKIPHGNIKPTNILVDLEGKLRYSDIGMIKSTANGSTLPDPGNKVENQFFVAPEMLVKLEQPKKKEVYKADAWSLGLILATLCLPELNTIDELMMTNKRYNWIIERLNQLQDQYSKTVTDLIIALLQLKPVERVEMSHILKILEENFPHILVSWWFRGFV